MSQIAEKIAENTELLKQLCDEFHQIPELGFQEFKTSARIASYLADWGLEVHTGLGRTGVAGILTGARRQGPVIAVRADMDALKLENGLVHACGHDSHMAIALATARVFSAMRSEFDGQIVFIFQPAEEGLGGAAEMLDDGLLELCHPQAIIGLHNWPELPLGTIGLKPGVVTANVDMFRINITGKSSHGAIPDQAVDPIVTASQVVLGLQTIVAREIAPSNTAVLSIGRIQGGSSFNIIPEKVELIGTVRTFSAADRKFIHSRIEQIATGICQAQRANCSIDYRYNIPCVVNHPDFVRFAQQALSQTRDITLRQVEKPLMIGEDFGLFLEEIPGCFLLLGTRSDQPYTQHPLHHPQYRVDRRALVHGLKAFSLVVEAFLAGGF